MAAPTLFAAGALFAAAAGTSITPVIPANDANNDIGVMACMCNGATTFSTPTNWTLLGTSINSANQSTAWFWKRLTGSDGNPTSTTSLTLDAISGGYGRIYVFRGCLTSATPFEAIANAGAPTLNTLPQTSQVITVGSQRLVCSLVLVDDDNPWASGMPPSGWSNMGGRLISTTGGDCMSDAISRVEPTATTVNAATIGTQSASDYWRTLSFALIPEPSAPIPGSATVSYGYSVAAAGTRIPSPQAPPSRAPIPAVLMVTTPGDWNVHPYYKVAVTPANWGNATDLALVDAALAGWPQRTRVVLIAEDDGTANGRCATALNWAMLHYDEVQEIALRAPIIDLVERHDRVGGAEATSIEAAHGGTGSVAVFPGGAGNYVSTPDHTDLDLVGDLDLRLELKPTDFTAAQSLVSKYLTTGNQRSYRLTLNATGNLIFTWSVLGTSTILTATSTVPIDDNGIDFEADGGAVRVTFDADNGSSGRTATFYTSPTIGGSWTILGTAVTSAGVTTIFSGTSVLEIGAVNTGALEQYTGQVTKMELRSTIGGTIVANPDFTAAAAGATSFADSTGKTWTIHGTTELVAKYTFQMSQWNPGHNQRLHMMRSLFNDRMHIWRDTADAVTPAAVTDAIADTAVATLHTTLGTTADVSPDRQDWPQQKALEQMKMLHDYARTDLATQRWRTADGAQTVVLPDGRWVTLLADTIAGTADADDTLGTFGVLRNSILVHDGNGNVTDQIFSAGPNTVAILADQIENPGAFYWPLGGAMEGGLLNIMCDLRIGGGFGVALDQHIVRMDPDDFSIVDIVSLGDTGLRTGTIYPDTDTGFIYGMLVQPARMWRTPIGELDNLAAYTYWDGSTWNTDKEQIAVTLRNLPGGGTAPMSSTVPESGETGGECYVRRWRSGWLAVAVTYLQPFFSIWYSDVPQGPWTLYTHLSLPNVGPDYYGAPLFGYFPFWHPEHDDGPNRLMISYNNITLIPPDEPDGDFLYLDPHFVIVEMHRDPFA